MGTSYLSDSEKNEMGDEFYNLHATFGRPIVMYKMAKQVVINTNPGHNFLFENAPTNDTIQDVIQSGVFLARILYGKKQNLDPFSTPTIGGGSDQSNIRLDEGDIRIKLDPTGASYIQDAERIIIDGNICQVNTSPRPHGLFDPKFQTFVLKRLN